MRKLANYIQNIFYKVTVGNMAMVRIFVVVYATFNVNRTTDSGTGSLCNRKAVLICDAPSIKRLAPILYRVSQEECAILRESVPYVKLYRYNPKHLYPKLNGYGDNGQRSLKL